MAFALGDGGSALRAQGGTALLLDILKLPEDVMESHVSVPVTVRASPEHDALQLHGHLQKTHLEHWLWRWVSL